MKNVKLSKTFISANGAKAGIRIDCGPWVSTARQDMIKIRPKKSYFPKEIREAVSVTNNSDMTTDYFEADSIVLLPGHPLYETAKALA